MKKAVWDVPFEQLRDYIGFLKARIALKIIPCDIRHTPQEFEKILIKARHRLHYEQAYRRRMVAQ